MEETDKSIFITGGPGRASHASQLFPLITRKKVAVLAPTGVAALNVKGQTILPFSALSPISPETGQKAAGRG